MLHFAAYKMRFPLEGENVSNNYPALNVPLIQVWTLGQTKKLNWRKGRENSHYLMMLVTAIPSGAKLSFLPR